MNLKNITLQEYLELEDQEEYNFFMRYSRALNNNPPDIFSVGDLTDRSFGLVKDLQFDLVTGMDWNHIIEYVMKLTGKKYASVAAYHIDKFCQGWKYITGEVERISEIEQQVLAYIATDDERRAGIEKLGVLGVYMQFRSIAITLGCSIDQVREMRYDEAFLELTTQKMLSEYEQELMKIRREPK
jgi:hypothetical protein